MLKVVCLNEGEELLEGTQKIRIIESVGCVHESHTFPVIGSGKNVQVHYQEVFPPPRQELTTLLSENRNDSAYRYQVKEEERKRVAIRRAEYANRIKGVSKTIVTTINADTDRISRSEGKGVDNRYENARPEVDSEDRREYLKPGEVQRYEVKAGRDGSIGKNGNKIKSKSPAKADTGKITVGQERERTREKEREEEKEKEKEREKDEERKYNLKDSIEYEKLSVKHKILAKLAGKDFKQYIDSVPYYDAEVSRPTKLDLPSESQSPNDYEILRDVSRCSEPEQVSDVNKSELNYTGDDSLRVEIQSSPSASSKNFANLKASDPNSAVESGEGDLAANHERAFGFADSGENPEDSNQYEIIDNVPVLEYEEQDEDIEEKDKHSENESESENEKENEGNEKEKEKERKFTSPEHIYSRSEEENVEIVDGNYASKGGLSGDDTYLISPEHIYAEERDPVSNFSQSPGEEAKIHLEGSEAKSFVRSSENDLANDDTALKHKFDDLSKISFDEGEEEVHINTDSLDHSDANLCKTIGSESFEDFTVAEDQGNSERLQRITEMDEEIQETPRESMGTRSRLEFQAQEGQEVRAIACDNNRSSEEQRKAEAVIDPEKVNMLFMMLTDAKVIKGLRLLGGFADYLEIHGKDILDWKH